LELIKTLANDTGPALGVEWLRQTALDPLFAVATVFFTPLMVLYILCGLSGLRPVTLFEEIDSFLKPLWRGSKPDNSNSLEVAPEGVAGVGKRWGRLKTLGRAARSGSARLVGGVLLVFAAVSPLISVPSLIGVACAVVGALLWLRAQNLRRFSWPVLAGAFGLSWAGLIAFAVLVPAPTETNWLSSLTRAGGIVITGVAFAVMSRVIMVYTPPPSQPRVRLTGLLCLAVLFGFFSYAGQPQFVTLG